MLMHMQEGRERRQHPRATVSWPVIIRSSRGFMSGETKDISYGGAFIRCREPLKPNEVLEVSISVSLLCPRVQVTAEVMWSNSTAPDDELTPRGMGVRFTNIAGTDQELISALVADRLQKEDPDPPERGSTI
jgi:c-di-GMP-binding flagellar brake protein YcgR